MKEVLERSIKEFLLDLDTDICIEEYIDIEDIDFDNAFDSIYESILNQGGFDSEIIYYGNAISFLSENDISLKRSLSLASEFGYDLEDLDSETLASLLYSDLLKDEFEELEDEINNFFLELQEEFDCDYNN